MLKMLKYLVLLSLPLFIAGCASSFYARGHNALEHDDYRTAVRQLKQAVAQNPRDLDAIRDLGIALYELGNRKLSKRLLAIVALRRPDDPVTAYYLGRIYEDSGDLREAIKYYKRYVNLGPFNPFRKQLEYRLHLLVKKELKRELADMLTREQQLNTASIPDNAVAVLYFLNLAKSTAAIPLQKGLTEMLITDLSQVKGLTLIERARLQALMEEMGLGQSGMVDASTAPRFGKLLGANRVVYGSLTQLNNKQLRIDAGVTDVKDQKAFSTEETGSLAELIKLEKNLVFNIIDKMGMQISPDERKAIEKVPTKNLVAFMYYCRALDQEDKGFYDKAAISYQQALAKDPGFSAASQGRERTQSLASYSPNTKTNFSAVTASGSGSRSAKTGGGRAARSRAGQQKPGEVPLTDAVGSRLDRTANNVTPGFMPGIESREATTEEISSTFGGTAPITIKIPVPVVVPGQ